LISERILKIWPCVESSTEISKSFDEEVSLSTDYIFTGRKIKGVMISDKYVEVETFRALKAEILSYFYKVNSNILCKLQEKDDGF
jgi:hypothetical protein